MGNWLSLGHFMTKVGGMDHVYDIVDALDGGAKQADIAESYGLDPGYLSRIIKSYCRRRLVLEEESLRFLASRTSHLEDHHADATRVRARVFELAATRGATQKRDGQ